MGDRGFGDEGHRKRKRIKTGIRDEGHIGVKELRREIEDLGRRITEVSERDILSDVEQIPLGAEWCHRGGGG